jgi:hypothetical protein
MLRQLVDYGERETNAEGAEFREESGRVQECMSGE